MEYEAAMSEKNWEKPSPTLLVKLGSLVVHAIEYIETGEPVDRDVIIASLKDNDVRQWIQDGIKNALLPLPRNPIKARRP